ncbi:MAG: GGDEF domain-containing protein [Vicinamibacterales bacterium]|nr:GGDEF domain-containing protein [Vicinamibacterales bacterium]
MMPRLLAEVCVVIGAFVLVMALVPARALVTKLTDEPLRQRWRMVQWRILAFLVGYAAYLVVFWDRHDRWEDLFAPAALLLAAFLTLAVVKLAFDTTAALAKPTAKLEREGITDALVGVYNRRYLEHRLSEEVARARRHAVPLSVLLFDIDHFRRVNEKWGRVVGDRVLNYLGHLLLGGVRESDVVARYGGEEIMVIAPATTMEQAVALAERLREEVERENLGFGGEMGGTPELQVTVSAGVGELQPEETEWEPLVARADAAVIRAKLSGRNRVAS